MINRKELYKEKLKNNGYINLENVCDFLRNNCIADYEVIAYIYGNGMSISDYEALQDAINEIQ